MSKKDKNSFYIIVSESVNNKEDVLTLGQRTNMEKHYKYQEALDEAQELCRQHNSSYYVLRSIAKTIPALEVISVEML